MLGRRMSLKPQGSRSFLLGRRLFHRREERAAGGFGTPQEGAAWGPGSPTRWSWSCAPSARLRGPHAATPLPGDEDACWAVRAAVARGPRVPRPRPRRPGARDLPATRGAFLPPSSP